MNTTLIDLDVMRTSAPSRAPTAFVWADLAAQPALARSLGGNKAQVYMYVYVCMHAFMHDACMT